MFKHSSTFLRSWAWLFRDYISQVCAVACSILPSPFDLTSWNSRTGSTMFQTFAIFEANVHARVVYFRQSLLTWIPFPKVKIWPKSKGFLTIFPPISKFRNQQEIWIFSPKNSVFHLFESFYPEIFLNFRGRKISPKSNFYAYLSKFTLKFCWIFEVKKFNQKVKGLTYGQKVFVIIWQRRSQLKNVGLSGISTRTFGIPVRHSTYKAIDSTEIGGEFYPI